MAHASYTTEAIAGWRLEGGGSGGHGWCGAYGGGDGCSQREDRGYGDKYGGWLVEGGEGAKWEGWLIPSVLSVPDSCGTDIDLHRPLQSKTNIFFHSLGLTHS